MGKTVVLRIVNKHYLPLESVYIRYRSLLSSNVTEEEKGPSCTGFLSRMYPSKLNQTEIFQSYAYNKCFLGSERNCSQGLRSMACCEKYV